MLTRYVITSVDNIASLNILRINEKHRKM